MTVKTSYHPDEVCDVSILWTGDVAVVGGGSAGATAATAAARLGASTLLIESGGFLGGTGTRVLDTFYGFYAPGPGDNRVVGGIGWEVCERLAADEMSFERPNTYGAGTGITYQPEGLKRAWDDVLQQSGAKTLLYGLMTAVIVDNQTVHGVIVETKRGPYRVLAKVVIDSSGEGEVAWRAGATIDKSGESETLQPATATFRVGGVSEQAASTEQIHALTAEAAASGEHVLPRLEGSIHITNFPGVRHANMTRVAGKDLTDPWQLSWAEREGRRQSWEYFRFLRNKVPGYAQSYLLNTSSRIGIRETRRLVGEYVLGGEDFIGGLSHHDDIARCGAPIEDHGSGSTTRWEYVGGRSEPDGSTYGIPYGAILPASVRGLIVAGRFFSATHEAHASARSIGQCTAMGQAAGTAAAIAARTGLQPGAIDRAELRGTLKETQAIV